jgi:dihydrofolate synthase/folylpolyglutamate synthase
VHSALDWLDSLQNSGIRPGLARIRALLRGLGRPHEKYPCVIVAGTNGKGSTSATLNSILHESGYRTGLYTSPHLVDIRERWLIAGAMIDETLLASSISALRNAADVTGIVPTYFEALTIIAFIAFAAAECEVVVLEVGMGGRLDATNVVRPVAALITPIGFDHMEFLGNTIRRIAAEKAGVIHRGALVLTSNRDETVLDVIRRRAAKFGSEVIVVHGSQTVQTPLAGEFQRDNIALAIRAAEEMRERFPRIDEESIARGVANTRWRGRLERFTFGDKSVVVDGCHNAHAARAVAPWIAAQLPAPRLLVFGIMGDKDAREVMATLFPLFTRVIATEPYPPRSMRAADIAEVARGAGLEAVVEADPQRAVLRALEEQETSVFVGGSLYLAGSAIATLDARIPSPRQMLYRE